jgi:hypothetical protein
MKRQCSCQWTTRPIFRFVITYKDSFRKSVITYKDRLYTAEASQRLIRRLSIAAPRAQ